MAQKLFHLEDVGPIQISKRRGQRTIRLTIQGHVAKVTQPSWLPYSAGESFAKARREWIKEHISEPKLYQDGQEIGGRTLHFSRSSTSRLGIKITDDSLVVLLPTGTYPEDDKTQEYIETQLTKLSRQKSEDYLPRRVAELAEMFGFEYRSVQIKQLKRRWGSCNSKKELVFNLKLSELDPLHIDYVILHELTHTIHMHHGPEFWDHLESVYPGAKKIAKVVRRITV